MRKVILTAALIGAISGSSSFTANANWYDYLTNQATNFSKVQVRTETIKAANANNLWIKGVDSDDKADGKKQLLFTSTSDGGMTWTASKIESVDTGSYTLSDYTPVSGTSAYALFFPDNSGDTGKLLYTSDQGTTWSEKSAPFSSKSFPNVVHMFNANDGYIMGDPVDGYYEIYTTSNGGSSWTRVPKASVAGGASPISGDMGTTGVSDAVGNTAFFATQKGEFFKSMDKGKTWTKKTISGIKGARVINGVFAHDANTIVVGVDSIADGNVWWHVENKITTDGGATWKRFNTPLEEAGETVVAPVRGQSRVWLKGGRTDAAGLAVSKDNGENWTDIEVTDWVTRINAIDKDNVYLGSWSGFPVYEKTTEGGVFKGIDALAMMLEADTGVEEINPLTTGNLSQNYPNPFNPTTMINFYLVNSSQVKLTVFDAAGKEITNLVNGKLATGEYNIKFDARNLPSGIYFYTLNIGNAKETKKMILSK